MLLNTHTEVARQPSGKTPIVFLHGVFGQGRNFRTLQKQLATDTDVLSMDLRNHGKSGHGFMDYPTMTADVLGTLKALGIPKAHLVGHSMGGKVAMCIALDDPSAVASLVTIDIPPAKTTQSSLGISKDIASLTFPDYLDLSKADALLKPYIPNQAVRQIMMQNMARGTNPHWKIGLNEIVTQMPTIMGWPQEWTEGKRYDGPTLFVNGGDSPYLRDEHKERIATLFPHAVFETIAGCGHWVHAQAPAAFLAILRHFFDTIQAQDAQK